MKRKVNGARLFSKHDATARTEVEIVAAGKRGGGATRAHDRAKPDTLTARVQQAPGGPARLEVDGRGRQASAFECRTHSVFAEACGLDCDACYREWKGQ